MFKPVKTRKVSEEIVDQIKDLIIAGKLQPGDKLASERELSETLAVSRTSIREAFSALEMMGIITIRPGEGSFVKQVSYAGLFEPLSFLLHVEVSGITQLLEVRNILEVEIAALAALRATPAALAEIQQTLTEMEAEIAVSGFGDRADIAFHLALAKATANPVLVKVMNTIIDLMTNNFRGLRQRLFWPDSIPAMIYQTHLNIFGAVKAKNPQLAQQYMREHLSLVETNMLRLQQHEPSVAQPPAINKAQPHN